MSDGRRSLQKYDDESPVGYILYELGEVFFEKMQKKFGGTDLKIPGRRCALKEDHWLVEALGREDAEELISLGPFERFYVPFYANGGTKAAQVAKDVAAGLQMSVIAKNHGISERHARRLKRQALEIAL